MSRRLSFVIGTLVLGLAWVLLPTPSVGHSPQPPVGSGVPFEGPAQVDGKATLEGSDSFWGPLVLGGEMEQWETLDEVVDASDLVVLGRPSGLSLGRTDDGFEGPDGNTYGSDTVLLMTVEVDEVIAGTLHPSAPGQIVLQWILPHGMSLEEVASRMPVDERSLFFLIHMATLARELGLPAERIARYGDQYSEINDEQGVLRDVAGLVRPIADQEEPLRFQPSSMGEPFDRLLEAAREAAD